MDIDDDALPEAGQIVQAYVISTSSKGCFLRLTRKQNGRVLVKDLSDGFVDSPEQKYLPGMLVSARVTEVNSDASHDSPQYQLSLRSSDVDGDQTAAALAKLSIDQVVSGTVQKVADFGVFVKVDDLNIVGLSRPLDAVSSKQNIHDVFTKGDVVRAKVLKIAGNRLHLGLKDRYFRDHDNEGTDNEIENSELNEPTAEEDEDILEEADASEDESVEEIIRQASLHPDDQEESDDAFMNDIVDEEVIKTETSIISKKRKAESQQSSNSDSKSKKLSAGADVLEWDDFKPAARSMDLRQVR